MKILITGSEGFLGERATAFLRNKHNVMSYGHKELDITNANQVLKTIENQKPDVVIHCAAISDTTYAQNHPEESKAINLQGTVNMARACALIGSKFVFMSSDQVYSGCTERCALSEKSSISPNNIYGLHKLEAECKTLELLPTAIGLRLTWMYDLPSSAYKLRGNLLVNLQKAFENNIPIKVSRNEMRSITSVWHVIERLEPCFKLPGGIYNFGCENPQNSYITFCAAAEAMGLPLHIVELDTERFILQPRNLAIDISKLRHAGIDFPSTIHGIKMSLKEDAKSRHPHL
ncbi:MAG: sugar nucleotide-binding protein [Bacteroidaceae bacterium]